MDGLAKVNLKYLNNEVSYIFIQVFIRCASSLHATFGVAPNFSSTVQVVQFHRCLLGNCLDFHLLCNLPREQLVCIPSMKIQGASSRNCATFCIGAPDASEEEAPWNFIHSETFHGKCATLQ